MAQYRIEYRCGHSETKQLYGKQVDLAVEEAHREWIEQLERGATC